MSVARITRAFLLVFLAQSTYTLSLAERVSIIRNNTCDPESEQNQSYTHDNLHLSRTNITAPVPTSTETTVAVAR